MKKISMFVCCVLGSMGLATANISYANMQNNTSGSSIQPRTGNSNLPNSRDKDFDKAMQECENTTGKDSHGGPDQSALTSCLQQKGYSKPENGGHEGKGNNGGNGSHINTQV